MTGHTGSALRPLLRQCFSKGQEIWIHRFATAAIRRFHEGKRLYAGPDRRDQRVVQYHLSVKRTVFRKDQFFLLYRINFCRSIQYKVPSGIVLGKGNEIADTFRPAKE